MQGRVVARVVGIHLVVSTLLLSGLIYALVKQSHEINVIKASLVKLENKIQLDSWSLAKTETGYAVQLGLRAARPEPLGKTLLEVAVPKTSLARIHDFLPTREGGTFELSKDSLWISRDGTEAQLTYNLWSNTCTLLLRLSAPTTFFLAGNHGLGSVALRIDVSSPDNPKLVLVSAAD